MPELWCPARESTRRRPEGLGWLSFSLRLAVFDYDCYSHVSCYEPHRYTAQVIAVMFRSTPLFNAFSLSIL